MPKKKQEKYEVLEDIPGIGPSISAKLRSIGINTVEALAVASVQEVMEAGIGRSLAEKLIEKARSGVSITFVTADELMELRKNVKKLTTGCKALDSLLDGGIETQSLTELYGEFGVGKSILCHQLAVNVQLPVEKGGLDGGVLYIDTENTFRPEWIVRIAKRLNYDPQEALRRIRYAEAYTSDHQMLLLQRSDKIIKENNIRLIIIDSLTAHFRSEYLGREMLVERQQKLNKHIHMLLRLARAFNACAVVTNQVLAKPDGFLPSAVNPAGGHIVAHSSHTRILLRKTAKSQIRIARLVSSPYLPEGEAVFKITDHGIEDVPDAVTEKEEESQA